MAHQHPPRFLKIVDDARTRVRETKAIGAHAADMPPWAQQAHAMAMAFDLDGGGWNSKGREEADRAGLQRDNAKRKAELAAPRVTVGGGLVDLSRLK